MSYSDELQKSFEQFAKEYTLGRGIRGVNNEEVIKAYEQRQKEALNKAMKWPDSNSAYFKAGGKGDVNSLQNKWR